MLTSTLMMKTRIVSETLVFNLALARLNARDNYIAFILRESFQVLYVALCQTIAFFVTHNTQSYKDKDRALCPSPWYSVLISERDTTRVNTKWFILIKLDEVPMYQLIGSFSVKRDGDYVWFHWRNPSPSLIDTWNFVLYCDRCARLQASLLNYP